MKGTEFNRCKTLADVGLVAAKLKKAGEDPNEVNMAASMKRRELATRVDKKVEILEKNVLKASAIPKNPVTHINVQFSGSYSNPVVRITQDRDVVF